MRSRMIAAVALCFPFLAFAALNDPVKVDGGLVSSTISWGNGVRMYRGIPFAAPPVGNLRWKEPQPVVTWEGVRAADHFGPACVQRQPPLLQAAYNTGV